jgi:peroxiredoxin
LAGYDAIKAEFDEMGISILAASVDPLEKAAEVQGTLSFPIAYGVTRDQATMIDAWWEDRRSIIQPSEFVLDGSGKVLSATYSTGPVGRMDAGDALRLVKFIEKKKAEAD